ncbi:MAG: serine hydrolase [Oribacterium sp.]|nr:serine hydrolase [Oribacterium sp.]
MNHMTDASRDSMEKRIREIMEDTCARGLAAAVIDKDGNTLYQNFFGYKDAEEKSNIDEDTLFGLASVTKSFTALSIMQMAKAGILSLYDPISKYIPEFTNKNQSEPVRIWHLLCHSGGFFPLPRIVVHDVVNEMGIKDTLEQELIYNTAFAERGVRLVAERLDNQKNLIGKPGEFMSYCNDGYGLLSDIIRRYSDCDSYAKYLERHILQPLGMDRSHISFIRSTLDKNAATLYTLENGTWRHDKDFMNDAFVLNGGGAMKSTLADLKKYLAMYLNEGTGLNGAEIADEYCIREMYKPRQYEKPGVWYGFGLETKMLRDMQIHQHGGSLPGVSSNIAFSEEAGIAVIVLCNTMDVPVSAISDLIFKTVAGLPTEDQRPEHAVYDWDEDFKRRIVGTYASGEGDTIKLSLESGRIAMTVNDKPTDMIPVYPREGLVRKTYSDMYLQFIETKERGVYAARYGSRIFPKTA